MGMTKQEFKDKIYWDFIQYSANSAAEKDRLKKLEIMIEFIQQATNDFLEIPTNEIY